MKLEQTLHFDQKIVSRTRLVIILIQFRVKFLTHTLFVLKLNNSEVVYIYIFLQMLVQCTEVQRFC